MPATPMPLIDPSHTWVDPMEFTQADFPLIVLCDDLRGALGFIIKTHTSGNYNHAMIMINSGKFVSQNTLLREISCKDYMHDYNMLKFWRIKNLNMADRGAIYNKVNSDLALPWYKRIYDYIGLAGQALWMPWIQLPWLKYCSEGVGEYIAFSPRIAKWMPKEPSPSDLDILFKAHPDDFETVGYWWAG